MTPVVAIGQSVLLGSRTHVRGAHGAYGFLFGHVEKATLGGQTTVIEGWWEVPGGDLRQANVQEFREAWSAAGAVAARQKLELAGWYHGHGLLGCTLSDRSVGCTLSERDIALHRSFFRHDWQCSMVIIPHERFPAGSFVLGDPGNRHEAATPVPFLEVLDTAPDPASGAVTSYVDWTNYARDRAINGNGERIRSVVVLHSALDKEHKKQEESANIEREDRPLRTFQIGAYKKPLEWPRAAGQAKKAPISPLPVREVSSDGPIGDETASDDDVAPADLVEAAALPNGIAETPKAPPALEPVAEAGDAAASEVETPPHPPSEPEAAVARPSNLEGSAPANLVRPDPDAAHRVAELTLPVADVTAPTTHPPFEVVLPTVRLLAPVGPRLALMAGSCLPVADEEDPVAVASSDTAWVAATRVAPRKRVKTTRLQMPVEEQEAPPLPVSAESAPDQRPVSSGATMTQITHGASDDSDVPLSMNLNAPSDDAGRGVDISTVDLPQQPALPSPEPPLPMPLDDGSEVWASACDSSNAWMDDLLDADPYRDFDDEPDAADQTDHRQGEVGFEEPKPGDPVPTDPETVGWIDADASQDATETDGETKPESRSGEAVADSVGSLDSAPSAPTAGVLADAEPDVVAPADAEPRSNGIVHEGRNVTSPATSGDGIKTSQSESGASTNGTVDHGDAGRPHHGGYKAGSFQGGSGGYGPPTGRFPDRLSVPGQPHTAGYDSGAAAYMMAAGHRLPPYPVYQAPSYGDGGYWPQPYETRPPGDPPSADISTYWRIIKDRRNTILAVLLAVFFIGTLSSLLQTPMFRASGTLEIRKQSGEVVPVEAFFQPDKVSSEYLETQYGILESRSLVRRVIANLGFTVSDPPQGATPVQMAAATEAEVDRFGSRLTINPTRGSRLVDVYFEHENPEAAAAGVNGVIAAYIDMRVESGRDAGDRLATQVDSVRGQLASSEARLRDYMREHDLIMITTGDGESNNLVNQRLEALQDQITQAEADRYQKESRFNLVQRGEYGLLDSPVLQQLNIKIADQTAEYARLRATFTDNYPRTRQVKDQLDELQSQFSRERGRIASEIRNDYEAAVARQELLTGAFEEQRGLIDRLAEASAEYNRLRRDVESNQDLYSVLQQHRQEAGVSAALASNDVAIIDMATAPRAPFSPNPQRSAAMSLILGLILGIAAAFLRELLDNSVRTVAEVGALIDVPVLAAIPSAPVTEERHLSGASLGSIAAQSMSGLKGSRRDVESSPLHPGWYRIDRDNARQSALSEAFGGLRTSVLVSRPEGPPQVILLTSAQPREGKTTVTVNLSLSLSRLGRRVLLVDADTRRPAIHRALSLDAGPGLVDYLAGRGPWRTLVQPDVAPGLDVLVAGAPPDSPSELLSSPAMAGLIHEARTEYDFVIVDSPALLVNVPDTRIIAPLADGVVLVMRSGVTPREAGRRMLQEIPNPIGVVLNDLSGDQLPGYYRMEEEQSAV